MLQNFEKYLMIFWGIVESISGFLGLSPEIFLIGALLVIVVIMPLIKMILGIDKSYTHNSRYL